MFGNKVINVKMADWMYYRIVEIWHTIFLDFTCSLDIMEKVISKKFLSFILYQNHWFLQLSVLAKCSTYNSIKLLITKLKLFQI